MFTTASPRTHHSRTAFVAALVAVGVSVGAASASADEPLKPVTADPAPFNYATPQVQARMARQAPLVAIFQDWATVVGVMPGLTPL